MPRTTYALLVIGTAAVLAAGCAEAPTADIEAARVAFEAAGQAEAGQYAAASYTTAQDARTQLEAELKAQEDKFGLFRSYEKAKELAVTARAAAEEAEQDAVAEKQRQRDEATALIADVKAALEETKVLLENAPRGKGTQADLEAMKLDLANVEAALDSADGALAGNRYADAKSQAQSARDTVLKVKSSIEQAIEARRGARRRT